MWSLAEFYVGRVGMGRVGFGPSCPLFSQMTYERTSDTLIGYQPIFQMLPKTSLFISYHWYPFEYDAWCIGNELRL